MEVSEMSLQGLIDTAKALVADDKGLLAMDESNPTCNKRFAKQGIPQTEEARRAYRELIVTTPGLGEFISGVILYDETIRQSKKDGTPFVKVITDAGIIPGIKVDEGTIPFTSNATELLTKGIDGLDLRLKKYASVGARFAKWRAVITIGPKIPTEACIRENARLLAQYAALCHENDIVPIVEPEVLMDGNHSLDRSFEVNEWTLGILFDEIRILKVSRKHLILKPSMVLPGKSYPEKASIISVAENTMRCLKSAVPPDVPIVAFLSGGQTEEEATAHLNEMNRMGPHPWVLTFSYARALQNSALQIWNGKNENVRLAQIAFLKRAQLNSAATLGSYMPSMETAQ